MHTNPWLWMITCIEQNILLIPCVLCAARKADALCIWSRGWTGTFECLRSGAMVCVSAQVSTHR